MPGPAWQAGMIRLECLQAGIVPAGQKILRRGGGSYVIGPLYKWGMPSLSCFGFPKFWDIPNQTLRLGMPIDAQPKSAHNMAEFT